MDRIGFYQPRIGDGFQIRQSVGNGLVMDLAQSAPILSVYTPNTQSIKGTNLQIIKLIKLEVLHHITVMAL